MEPRQRASPEQFSVLIDFMERHGDLSRPQSGPQGRVKGDQLWQQLTVALNSLGGGVKKSSDKWKKLETANERPLEHAIDTVLEDHNSQNIAIPTPVTPAVLVIDQPEEDTPALNTPAPPQSLPSQSPPPPPPPPLPRTPPARNIRRQASPRSPSTTPRRALLRARRNRGLTPFERAADLFATVEQRRLEHEETRDKRLHEREMERLRLEAERIDVTRQHNNLLHQLSLLGQQLIDVITQQRPSNLPSTDPI